MEGTLPTWLELESVSQDLVSQTFFFFFCQPRDFVDLTRSDAGPASANGTMAVSITQEGLKSTWVLWLATLHMLFAFDSTLMEGERAKHRAKHSE